MRRAAYGVMYSFESVLTLQKDIVGQFAGLPKQLHRAHMWFVLEELELCEMVRQRHQAARSGLEVMQEAATRLGKQEQAMVGYFLTGFISGNIAKIPSKHMVVHWQSVAAAQLPSKPCTEVADVGVGISFELEAGGAECAEVQKGQLETVVGPVMPTEDAKLPKPPQLVYQDASYFNAPQHQVKTTRRRVQTEDSYSSCSESDAGTVLAEGQASGYEGNTVETSGTVKSWLELFSLNIVKLKIDKLKIDKLKLPISRIDLRNVHDLMVVGGLYPPTDTPPPWLV
jgi:hypothetical protein